MKSPGRARLSENAAMRSCCIFFALLFSFTLHSQTPASNNLSTLRGIVTDARTGEPLAFALVFLRGTTIGTQSDVNGFYSLTKIKPGTYTVVVRPSFEDRTGPDSAEVILKAGEIFTRNIQVREDRSPPPVVIVSRDSMKKILRIDKPKIAHLSTESYRVLHVRRADKKWKRLLETTSLTKWEATYTLVDSTFHAVASYDAWPPLLKKTGGDAPDEIRIVRQTRKRLRVRVRDNDCGCTRAVVIYKREN